MVVQAEAMPEQVMADSVAVAVVVNTRQLAQTPMPEMVALAVAVVGRLLQITKALAVALL